MSTGQASSHAPQGLMGFVHRRRRGAELVLLILSLVVGIGAYAAVGLGVDGTLPVNLFTYGAWLAGLVIACHVVIRIFAAYADPILLPIVSALNGIGLAMIHRIDLARQASRPSSNGFADAQLIWMTLGRDPLRRRADRASATTVACSRSPTPSGSPPSCCCCCRCCPASAGPSTAPASGSTSGR